MTKVTPPVYNDGVLQLFKILEDTETGDFPREYLKDMGMNVWYRELSVFDRIRFQFEEKGKEVTKKVAIPRYKELDTHYACKIGGLFHQIYNVAHTVTREGFPETELTLIQPERNLEVKS